MPGAGTRAAARCPALRRRRARCLAAADAAGEVRLANRPPLALHPRRIGNELVSDSLVYRYNVEASPDGLRGVEGTFSPCTFWYVEALAGQAASKRRAWCLTRCLPTRTTLASTPSKLDLPVISSATPPSATPSR